MPHTPSDATATPGPAGPPAAGQRRMAALLLLAVIGVLFAGLLIAGHPNASSGATGQDPAASPSPPGPAPLELPILSPDSAGSCAPPPALGWSGSQPPRIAGPVGTIGSAQDNEPRRSQPPSA